MTSQNRTILVVIIVIIIAALGYFIWKERQGTAVSSPTASSTPVSLTMGSSTAATSTPGYTINPVYAPNIPAPDLTTPLAFSSTVTAAEQASLQSQFVQVQATLKATPKDYNALIALGNLRKQAGDYAGAAIDWQYVSALFPGNVVSNANLGDLYVNFLPDYAKAVAAYKAQIAIVPQDTYIYSDLAILYANKYPQGGDPAAILMQGIKANPNATDLQVQLARYYKSKGNTAAAKAQYDAAAASATAQGQTDSAAQIKAEEAAM